MALFGHTLRAEEFGFIQGKTTAPDQSALSGVTIQLSCQDSHLEKTLTSDQSGFFYSAGLLPGLYTIRFETPGYLSTVLPGVYVLPAQSLFIRAVLQKKDSEYYHSTYGFFQV